MFVVISVQLDAGDRPVWCHQFWQVWTT